MNRGTTGTKGVAPRVFRFHELQTVAVLPLSFRQGVDVFLKAMSGTARLGCHLVMIDAVDGRSRSVRTLRVPWRLIWLTGSRPSSDGKPVVVAVGGGIGAQRPTPLNLDRGDTNVSSSSSHQIQGLVAVRKRTKTRSTWDIMIAECDQAL